MSVNTKSIKKISATEKNKELDKVDWTLFSPGPVVGVDEVGRGCLAGPVYAAAVCLKSGIGVSLLTDSKLLSEKRREELFPILLQEHWYGIGSASVEEIDQINILQASLLAMKRAVDNLSKQMGVRPGHVLVDGNMKIPGVSENQTAIVKGDLRCSPISAASIVAKVTRDRLMKELGEKYPQYEFEKHKGYASATHKKAIEKWGPCQSIHRESFSGVKEFVARPLL